MSTTVPYRTTNGIDRINAQTMLQYVRMLEKNPTQLGTPFSFATDLENLQTENDIFAYFDRDNNGRLSSGESNVLDLAAMAVGSWTSRQTYTQDY